VAADFFTVEVWTRQGLRRFVVLFVMELATRKVEVAGIGPAPNGLWMRQVARNLTAAEDGIVNGKRYLIHDRDPLFTAEFLKMLADVGVQLVKLPPRSPNLNAYAERFVRTIKESCLDRMILFGDLGYHLKTGHQLSLQNRPTESHPGPNDVLPHRRSFRQGLSQFECVLAARGAPEGPQAPKNRRAQMR
jgi:putative transposase